MPATNQMTCLPGCKGFRLKLQTILHPQYYTRLRAPVRAMLHMQHVNTCIRSLDISVPTQIIMN
eukprot:1243923-Amphidinium_carterae.1